MIVDKVGHIKLHSQVATSPTNINATVDAKSIDLSQFNAWIPPSIKLSIDKGDLSFQQEIHINNAVESKGSIAIDKLKLLDKNKSVFLLINQLNLEQFLLDSGTKTIKLDEIKLAQAQGAFVLSADKKFNLSELIEQKDSTTKSKKADDLDN